MCSYPGVVEQCLGRCRGIVFAELDVVYFMNCENTLQGEIEVFFKMDKDRTVLVLKSFH